MAATRHVPQTTPALVELVLFPAAIRYQIHAMTPVLISCPIQRIVMGAVAHVQQASTVPWESVCYVPIHCPMLVTVDATILAQIHQIAMVAVISAMDRVLTASVYPRAHLGRLSADLGHLTLPV